MPTTVVPAAAGRSPADAGPSTPAGPVGAGRSLRDTSPDTEVQPSVASGLRAP